MPRGKEHDFATGLMKLWRMQSRGWAFRIPDSWHTDKQTGERFSHKRPADWMISCKAFSALVEFKYMHKQLSFDLHSHLRPSQRQAIEEVSQVSLRYYLVIGNGDAVWAFNMTSNENRQIVLADHPVIGWAGQSSLIGGYELDHEAMLD